MSYTRSVAVAASSAELAAAARVQLTPHFTLAEFYVHELPPADVQSDKLPQMAQLAEWLRVFIVGGPVIVKSYFRSDDHNASVGGAPASPHLTGDGLDLVPLLNPGFDVIARRVTAAIAAGTAPAFGSMIFYQDQGHVHVSAPGVPNGDQQVLLFSPTEDSEGRSYIAFQTYAQFLRLWNSDGGRAAILLLVVTVILFSVGYI